MAHPAVAEAAVIAIPTSDGASVRWRWSSLGRREATPDELRAHLASEFAKWQLPERFEFIDAIRGPPPASSRRRTCASASSRPRFERGAAHPGAPVRGSRTGRPVMALLDLLGRRWSLRVLWELRDGSATERPGASGPVRRDLVKRA